MILRIKPGNRPPKNSGAGVEAASLHNTSIRHGQQRPTGLLRRINPINWFDEFRDIHIGLEEPAESNPAKIVHSTTRVKKFPLARLFFLHKFLFVLSLIFIPTLVNSQQAQQTFARLFPHAINQRWVHSDQATFVYFNNKQRNSFAVFSLQGLIKYTVTFLRPTDLDTDMQRELHARFPTAAILYLRKIDLDNNEILQIILESQNGYIVVNTVNGELVETKQLKK